MLARLCDRFPVHFDNWLWGSIWHEYLGACHYGKHAVDREGHFGMHTSAAVCLSYSWLWGSFWHAYLCSCLPVWHLIVGVILTCITLHLSACLTVDCGGNFYMHTFAPVCLSDSWFWGSFLKCMHGFDPVRLSDTCFWGSSCDSLSIK